MCALPRTQEKWKESTPDMADSDKGQQLANGTIFKSRYEITGFLGEGGFASVYAAKDVEIGREVAIKILHILATTLDPTTHVSIVERFRQEARTAAQIKHPAVMTIFDVGMTDDNHPYIIMDLLEGHDLEKELETHGPMELARALPLFCRCLEALAEAHRLNIVHKDLKPSNLFLTHPRSGRESISILDFGIARVTEDNDARLTSAGQILGTPRYMAPEYIDTQTVSPATDVYQMGLILIEMLIGVPVVKQETLISCIMVHASGVDVPHQLRDSPLGPILEKAIARDPAERISDCETFLDILMATDFTPMGLPNAAMAISRMTSRMPAIDPSMTPGPMTPAPQQTPAPPKTPISKPKDPTAHVPAPTPTPSPTPAPSKPSGGGGGMALKLIGIMAVLGILAAAAVGGAYFMGLIGPPPPPPPTQSGDPMEAAKEAMDKGNWDEALSSIEEVLEADKGDKAAKKLKKKATKEKKNAGFFDEGKAKLEEGDVEAAEASFKKIPDGSFYSDRIKDARKEVVNDMLKAAADALDEKDIDTASQKLAVVEALDPDNKKAKKLSKKMPKGAAMISVKGGALNRGIDADGAKTALELCKTTRAQGEKCALTTFAPEQPTSLVGIKAFKIDKYEVTNKQYAKCVKAGKCEAARYSTTCGGQSDKLKADDHPVVCVTHADAKAFCEWADKRLPSEAEWEFAARGNDKKNAFPWGESWKPSWANWGDGDGSVDKHEFTAPVGAVKKDVAASGARDMGGNVAEWVADFYSEKFYKEDAHLAPLNTTKTRQWSARGGSWLSGGHTTRATWRAGLALKAFNAATGFRCAK